MILLHRNTKKYHKKLRNNLSCRTSWGLSETVQKQSTVDLGANLCYRSKIQQFSVDHADKIDMTKDIYIMLGSRTQLHIVVVAT